ncbi:MAG: type II toxin-antitoxin system RelE/ParE family toxin [Nitrospinae bacterium]|nr:type II toxin-antitoxin system RelE/ParE family toxin [Nitrospinota bacterium]
MAYKVTYKESVGKDLNAIDRPARLKIMDKIEGDLALDPAAKGKALKGKWKGLNRYEVWPYRVIYTIVDADSLLVVRIGHRKDVYR